MEKLIEEKNVIANLEKKLAEIDKMDMSELLADVNKWIDERLEKLKEQTTKKSKLPKDYVIVTNGEVYKWKIIDNIKSFYSYPTYNDAVDGAWEFQRRLDEKDWTIVEK